MDQRGGRAFDRRERLPAADVRARNRPEQSERVRHPRPIEHVIDVAATVLDLANLPHPTIVNSVQQMPLHAGNHLIE